MAYTTIKKPSDYFNTVTYVANQTDNRQITVGFQPDFTWLRDRDQAVSHQLYDGVRGALKALASNNANAESTETDTLKSFNSTGFTLGTGWGNQTTGDDYVAWNWLGANGTASNTDGSITSTVSANTTSGFSIVSYSGDGGSSSTVGHGLGAIPKMVIIKCKTTTTSWQNWGDGYTRLSLNNTDGDLGNYGMTRGASTVTLPNGINDWNGSGQDYIMYCWSEVKGFSKFGSYTGNGSTDGTFVYTGFKPAFVIIKGTVVAGDWCLFDNKRSEFNLTNKLLLPNTSDAESTPSTRVIDILSNGFKIRGSSSDVNSSGNSHIYMAFAEEPLVGDNPCTAR